jgi:bifunctional non-homologous end joining protein LigD
VAIKAAVLCAFDPIEIDGKDLRGEPIEQRKQMLAYLLFREPDGISVNDHHYGDGAIVYKQACALDCEGIVSKRLGSPYRSGRFNDWLKIKNPTAPTHCITSARTKLARQTRQIAMRQLQVRRPLWCAPCG